MRAPEFDVVGWLKDLSPIVLTIDIDLAYLCILGLAGYPANEEEYYSRKIDPACIVAEALGWLTSLLGGRQRFIIGASEDHIVRSEN